MNIDRCSGSILVASIKQAVRSCLRQLIQCIDGNYIRARY
jgi:hypothetical protein